MRRYFDFSGRSSRAQFWIFTLVVIVLVLVAAVIGAAIGGGESTAQGPSTSGSPAALLLALVVLVHFIPSLAVQVRRLHDSNKSGWWVLLNVIPAGQLVLLIMFCLGSTPGPNRFGPNPREPRAADVTSPAGVVATPPTMARAAPPAVGAAPRAPAAAPGHAPLDQLEKLATLRQTGAIDEDEFRQMKARLLGGASPQA
jgi:uncharacterized membrane protein YhaH (DUF805 family)